MKHYGEKLAREASEAARNLKSGIFSIEQQLLDRGIDAVSAREIARAKAAIMPGRPDRLRVYIDPHDVESISLIGMNFGYWTEQPTGPESINIIGWANKGDHLSGPASPEQFAERILHGLDHEGEFLDL